MSDTERIMTVLNKILVQNDKILSQLEAKPKPKKTGSTFITAQELKKYTVWRTSHDYMKAREENLIIYKTIKSGNRLLFRYDLSSVDPKFLK